MPSPNHDCRCYHGDPCTKTTMCYVQDVEKDLQDEIDTLREAFRAVYREPDMRVMRAIAYDNMQEPT